MIEKRKVLIGAVFLVIITVFVTYNIATGIDPLQVFAEGEVVLGGHHYLNEQDYRTFKKLEPLINVMNIVKERYYQEVDENSMIDGAIKGAVDSLNDPYSVYMTPEEFKNLMIHVNGNFEGIGITVTMDENGLVRVISPIEDTPAQRAGIKPDDIIVKVDDTELKGLTLDEAVNLMRGPKGTKVTIYVQREGETELLKFEIIRAAIKLKTVKYKMLENQIGYIRITSFDSDVYKEFKTALKNLRSQKMRGLILDLRNNPGGSLQESVRIADELMGESLIVYTEDRDGNCIEEFKSDSRKIDVPLVVLVNEYSASASEIVAGAVQDSMSGTLIGTKTYGKGSVQEIDPLENGSGLKLTIAKYFLPSGRSIHGVGIEPDIKVELPEGKTYYEITPEEDTQLKKAIELLKLKSRKN
ncbi:MAG: carboxyl-terminal processing protease [Thermosediminibacterales bacterium]|nr:carboxyl-terminal processing protease [Thermosediminibacterales bacterium]MDK2836162.1 carboxyl-terminal processing protease [Thermosediminibacterales bacterium]